MNSRSANILPANLKKKRSPASSTPSVRLIVKFFVCLLSLLILAAVETNPATLALNKIEEDYWKHELNQDIDLRLKYGLPIDRFPDLSYRHATDEGRFAQSILNRLAQINSEELKGDEALSAEILKWNATEQLQFPRYFYLIHYVTPYSSPLPGIHRVFTQFGFQNKKDLEHYKQLLNLYPNVMEQIRHHLEEQSSRKILIPKEELQQVQNFLNSFQETSEKSIFYVRTERLAAFSQIEIGKFQKEVA